MSKKSKRVLLSLVLALLFMPSAVWAGNPWEKLARGITNVATSPGEFIYQMDPALESTPDKITGYILGLFRGAFFTVKRAGVGLYDIVTFPVAKPADYAPVYQPETLVKDVLRGSYFNDPTPPVKNG
ncbi:MAG: exosortase system-associated protein, TIGR04073 family [Candidatus Omnitrophota bacterium]